MKVELEAKNIIIDGIDVFDHIGKVEKEANELVQRINKAVSHLNLFISDEQLSKYDTLKILMHTKRILEGIEEK